MSKEEEPPIIIYEDWNEIDGVIYYRWRINSDDEWKVKKTSFKQKPYIISRTLTKKEWELRRL